MDIQERPPEEQLLFLIQGQGGSGKSLLISYFTKLFGNQVMILAQSGSAAIGVSGRTINNGLDIPFLCPYQ